VKARELVESTLRALVDRFDVDDHGNYIVGIESARVFIVPAWLQDARTVLRVFAVTNLDVPVTSELTSYLLERNLEFIFGAFALDVERGAVWFNHNLLGDYATPEELTETLGAVAFTANRFDDEIKTRFGGRLYTEAPDETAVPPPPTGGYL
jgi:hypothetical protein